MEFTCFGLFHCNDLNVDADGALNKERKDGVLQYLKNAVSLSKSLACRDVPFTLLTNKKKLLEDLCLEIDTSYRLDVVEIPFSIRVPLETPFYSAHHKIDAYEYVATLGKGYYIVCDLDVICINPKPECLENIVRSKTPLFYDISDQHIPAYGHRGIIGTLSSVGKIDSIGRWAGGEFIGGCPEFFKMLTVEIDSILDNYISSMPRLHHIGDESLTSSAIERLHRRGVFIADSGALLIVGRFWNAAIQHHQKPLAHYKDLFLLHLPADKKFIASIAHKEVNYFRNLFSVYNRFYFSIYRVSRRIAWKIRSRLLVARVN